MLIAAKFWVWKISIVWYLKIGPDTGKIYEKNKLTKKEKKLVIKANKEKINTC